ncbi:MAG: CcoQ/FixQ family Cbb3-type cytochrome c oxidase assembly chaperone [Chitinophagaceae bacterium]|nr:CcoQ/FixQ family Cbb3-type cytochrome c oxidase assembly chaperone [Chitinophagaceae bacterium]
MLSHSLALNNKATKMKFINYLESITGVDIYAMMSFMIFFIFFIVMVLWAWKADKKLIDKINRIPLDN